MRNVQFAFFFLPAPKIYFSGFFVDIRILGKAGLKTLQFKRVESYDPGLCWCLKSSCLVAQGGNSRMLSSKQTPD